MATQPAPRSFQFWDTLAATPDIFNLDAGKYGLTLAATVWGTARLSRVIKITGGVVIVPVAAADTVADGYSVYELPAGRYQLVTGGITGLSGLLEQIAPGRMGG